MEREETRGENGNGMDDTLWRNFLAIPGIRPMSLFSFDDSRANDNDFMRNISSINPR
jgi:hypothetical protein